MKRKQMTKTHTTSIKIVSNSIDKNWSFDSETKMFSHPIYPNKFFKAICKNKKREQVNVFIDKFGKKHKRKCIDMVSTLFPFIPPDEDPRNIGYNSGASRSVYHFDIIPNKTDASILSIYTNYEGDHTQPYDTILGCRVSTLDKIPQGMIGQKFKNGNYTKFIAKGDLNQGAVYHTWLEIWNTTIDRTYIADYEVYGEEAQNPSDAVVEIFVGIH